MVPAFVSAAPLGPSQGSVRLGCAGARDAASDSRPATRSAPGKARCVFRVILQVLGGLGSFLRVLQVNRSMRSLSSDVRRFPGQGAVRRRPKSWAAPGRGRQSARRMARMPGRPGRPGRPGCPGRLGRLGCPDAPDGPDGPDAPDAPDVHVRSVLAGVSPGGKRPSSWVLGTGD